MPLARSTLHSLRLKAGIKAGRFANLVEASRNHYSNVERGRKPGSPELFGRCARVLSEQLNQEIDLRDLVCEDAAAEAEAPTAAEATPTTVVPTEAPTADRVAS